MPHEIVEKHRPIYRGKFVTDTLRNLGGAREYKAFDGSGCGFENCFIVVNFDGPSHAGVFAHNFVKGCLSGRKQGIIQLSPDVRDLPRYRQKEILAEEWLEVMLKFDGRLEDDYKVQGKIEMVVLFNNLKQRTIWQDSPDFLIRMHAALRYLLISTQSIEEMLAKDFESSITKLKELAATDINGAMRLIEMLVKSFSGFWDVEEELVFNRLQETLFRN